MSNPKESSKSPPSFVAILPAAGLSRRMGAPKLLLPWGQSTIVENLIGSLHQAGIKSIVAVIRASDTALAAALTKSGATVIQPSSDPPDMRTSVQIALQSLAPQISFNAAGGGWLLCPADCPLIHSDTIRVLTTQSLEQTDQILIPTFEGRRGHPVLLPWRYASEVPLIPQDCGLNWLIRQNAGTVREIPVTDPGIQWDIDTPEDYQRGQPQTP